MNRDAGALNAVADANEFLSRFIPAASIAGMGRESSNLKPLFLPLYIGSGDAERGKIVISGKLPVSRGDLVRISADRYLVMVTDTPPQAANSAMALTYSNAAEDIQATKLATGEGVLLARLRSDPGIASERLIEFPGANGTVSVAIHDCRSNARSLPLAVSLDMERAEVRMALARSSTVHANSVARARVIAGAITESINCDLTLKHLQHEIEKMSGARISLGSVSVQDIVEELEDLLDTCGHSVTLPNARKIRSMILDHMAECRDGSSAIIRSVALAVIGAGQVRVA